ncbi:DUF2442 domain-containing protein [Fodinibius salsisoli]|uniref:DUF2442 domain-containing protein n=1 Tax=Fodinibius salsisoli TaxID=2820877 RepID=A0ABT3PK06_9BACT|nr:DUF2442 domain-containing protein [Fodinibius salsisoli]MCW9706275.1 DUF2442 domain-containing protein [Fodinibius salsisoli]
MKKQELLNIIFDLPNALREQLADEIYQSIDSSESGLNADWIVEANHLMRKFENIPPPLPDDMSPAEETENSPDDDGDSRMKTLFDLIEKIHLHCTLRARTKSFKEGDGIPVNQVKREIKERRKQREKLLGGLKTSSGPVPDVSAVSPLDNFKLELTFESGEQRIFDLKPLRKGIFSELQDPDYFSWAGTHRGGIRWPYGETLYSNILYTNSIPKDK